MLSPDVIKALKVIFENEENIKAAINQSENHIITPFSQIPASESLGVATTEAAVIKLDEAIPLEAEPIEPKPEPLIYENLWIPSVIDEYIAIVKDANTVCNGDNEVQLQYGEAPLWLIDPTGRAVQQSQNYVAQYFPIEYYLMDLRAANMAKEAFDKRPELLRQVFYHLFTQKELSSFAN